jgi:outer membrane protein assembly factor BamE (lipoprotein component of BamABCDE complex)
MKGKGLAGAVAVAILLQACSPLVANHGYVPPESALAQLQIGVDTAESVVAKLGRPTTTGVLGNRGLYYVQSRFSQMAFFEPQEIDREVLVLSFNGNGTLGNIERFGLEDGRVVQLNPARTAEVFADRTFVSQLLGNIGRFDAGSLIGGEDVATQ